MKSQELLPGGRSHDRPRADYPKPSTAYKAVVRVIGIDRSQGGMDEKELR